MGRLLTSANRIQVVGPFTLADLRRVIAAIHNHVRDGQHSLIIDFSQCVAPQPGPMAALRGQIAEYRRKRIEFKLLPPTNLHLARLFSNSNWAHVIDPDRHGPSRYRGYTNMPLERFAAPEDQTQVVGRFINALLCAIPVLNREDFGVIEWCVSEITDNVLVHAQSHVGGFVSMSSFKERRRVEFSVADAGIGFQHR